MRSFICFVLNLLAVYGVIFGIALIRVIFFYLQLSGITVVFLMNESAIIYDCLQA